MSYEDVIRVAQAKIDPARMRRIAAEIGAKPGEPFTVTEFLKPGIEEMCSILPPALARRILATAERRGWLERAHWGMEVNTASVSGFLRFWLLAKLRWLAAEILPLPGRAACDRGLARAHRRSRAPVRRSRARGRGMRAADQGLWRHPQARHRQLPPDRGPHHPAGRGGPNPACPSHRCRRERARGGAHRSRRRRARALPRRGRSAQTTYGHRRRVTWDCGTLASPRLSSPRKRGPIVPHPPASGILDPRFRGDDNRTHARGTGCP